MKTKLLLLAVPCALALGLSATAQSIIEAGKPGDPIHAARPRPLPTQPDVPATGVEPTSTPKGEAVHYCDSTPNSTGWPAFIGCTNDFHICHNAMSLSAYSVPSNVTGMFFYGSKPAQIPFANGTLCVSPMHPGLFRLPPVMTGHDHTAQLKLDFKSLPAAGQITCGTSWNFQFWFRDPTAGGAGSNLSDAVRITFCH